MIFQRKNTMKVNTTLFVISKILKYYYVSISGYMEFLSQKPPFHQQTKQTIMCIRSGKEAEGRPKNTHRRFFSQSQLQACWAIIGSLQSRKEAGTARCGHPHRGHSSVASFRPAPHCSRWRCCYSRAGGPVLVLSVSWRWRGRG